MRSRRRADRPPRASVTFGSLRDAASWVAPRRRFGASSLHSLPSVTSAGGSAFNSAWTAIGGGPAPWWRSSGWPPRRSSAWPTASRRARRGPARPIWAGRCPPPRPSGWPRCGYATSRTAGPVSRSRSARRAPRYICPAGSTGAGRWSTWPASATGRGRRTGWCRRYPGWWPCGWVVRAARTTSTPGLRRHHPRTAGGSAGWPPTARPAPPSTACSRCCSGCGPTQPTTRRRWSRPVPGSCAATCSWAYRSTSSPVPPSCRRGWSDRGRARRRRAAGCRSPAAAGRSPTGWTAVRGCAGWTPCCGPTCRCGWTSPGTTRRYPRRWPPSAVRRSLPGR